MGWSRKRRGWGGITHRHLERKALGCRSTLLIGRLGVQAKVGYGDAILAGKSMIASSRESRWRTSEKKKESVWTEAFFTAEKIISLGNHTKRNVIFLKKKTHPKSKELDIHPNPQERCVEQLFFFFFFKSFPDLRGPLGCRITSNSGMQSRK